MKKYIYMILVPFIISLQATDVSEISWYSRYISPYLTSISGGFADYCPVEYRQTVQKWFWPTVGTVVGLCALYKMISKKPSKELSIYTDNALTSKFMQEFGWIDSFNNNLSGWLLNPNDVLFVVALTDEFKKGESFQSSFSDTQGFSIYTPDISRLKKDELLSNDQSLIKYLQDTFFSTASIYGTHSPTEIYVLTKKSDTDGALYYINKNTGFISRHDVALQAMKNELKQKLPQLSIGY